MVWQWLLPLHGTNLQKYEIAKFPFSPWCHTSVRCIFAVHLDINQDVLACLYKGPIYSHPTEVQLESRHLLKGITVGLKRMGANTAGHLSHAKLTPLVHGLSQRSCCQKFITPRHWGMVEVLSCTLIFGEPIWQYLRIRSTKSTPDSWKYLCCYNSFYESVLIDANTKWKW